MNAPSQRAAGKFISVSAPSEGFCIVLDDQGQLWTRYKRPDGSWTWAYVEPPPVAVPAMEKK